MNDEKNIQGWTPGEPWRRFLATLIDLALFLPIAVAAVPATEVSIRWQNAAPLAAINFVWWFTALFLVVVFQGSPGKRILGLRILRTDGGRVGWMEAINRQILFIGLSVFSILHQNATLKDAPMGTDLQAYLDLLTQGQSSWTWVGDAGLALLWASCLLILMRPDRRAIYDLWSGTVVVRPVKIKTQPA